MVATRHPMLDMVYNDQTGRYVGLLERKYLVLILENLRFRALLELLTGNLWDDVKFDREDHEIFDIAVETIEQRLGLSPAEARRLVSERWTANNPPEADDSTKTWLVGMPKRPDHVVTHSRPIGAGAAFDHKKHLQGLETARRHREEAAGLRRAEDL